MPLFVGSKLSTCHFYHLLTFRGVLWDFRSWFWDPIIPLKHRGFLWLLFWGHQNTRELMVRKGWSAVAPSAGCDLCPALETVDHLALRCRSVNAIWDRLLLAPLACDSPDIQHFVCKAADQLHFKRKWDIAFAASAVTLWHARNDHTFNDKC